MKKRTSEMDKHEMSNIKGNSKIKTNFWIKTCDQGNALVKIGYAGFHASGKSCGQNGPKFITSSIFLPNIKSNVSFFFLHNVDYGTAK